MLDNLYENIGEKIKSWAKWIFIAEAIGAILTGIFMVINSFDVEDFSLFIYGISTIILGTIVAWMSSWILYAFGQLVDDTHAIRNQNTKINNIDNPLKIIDEPKIDENKEKTKCEVEKNQTPI